MIPFALRRSRHLAAGTNLSRSARIFFALGLVLYLTAVRIPGAHAQPDRRVVFHAMDRDGPQGVTEFFNDPASEDIVIVRATGAHVWYAVPPGETATILPGGQVVGSSPLEAFGAGEQETGTTVSYRVVDVHNYDQSANEGGPWRPVAVGDLLNTCSWYQRATPNTSDLTVVNTATGDTARCPRLDVIFVPVAHHVPEDPRFENIFNYSNLADFNYAPIDISFDAATVTNSNRFRPNEYQTGLRGSHGEAVTPQRQAAARVDQPAGGAAGRDLWLGIGLNPRARNSSHRIAFSLPRSADTQLRIFSLTGRLVTTLLDRPMESGRHEVTWSGVDDRGEPAPAGVYFVELGAGGAKLGRKLVLAH